jgi:hypothetical protein
VLRRDVADGALEAGELAEPGDEEEQAEQDAAGEDGEVLGGVLMALTWW